MELRILGPLEVLDDQGRAVPVGHSRERALLCLLTASANRVVSASRLTDELWPEAPPANALHALRVHTSRLRKALREAGLGDLVVTRPPGYLLQVEAAAVDTLRFEALVAEGRRQAAAGDPEAAATTFRAALGLWRGPALAEVADAPMARAEAVRLEEARLVALEDRIDADLAARRHQEVAAELDTLTQAHPLRERLWSQRMLALYRSGRQAEALRACRALRQVLAEELGLDPSPAVARLEHDILRQAPELEPTAAPAPAPQTTAGLDGQGEQKHVTVLFATVDGLVALSERLGPEAAHELVDSCFRVVAGEVERYGGTVSLFTGDGLMALFGAPVAHEDHAAQAVHAAWAIQRAMADRPALRLRLGVNTGPVVMAKVAGPTLGSAAMGATVNVGAALQRAASAGGTLVGETTFRAAGAAFQWGPPRQLGLEEGAGPLTAHELLGPGTTRRRFDLAAQRGLTRFVGRDAELAELMAAWRRTSAGSGQIISLMGEAGLGKSRLVHEFKRCLAEHDTPVFEGSCIAYGEVTPFLPFLEVVRAVLGLDPSAAVGEIDLDTNTAVSLRLLLGHPVPEEVFDRLSPAAIRQGIVDAIGAVVLAEADTQPLVLIIEDAHWIDTASEEALAALVEAMTDRPLLVLLVYRPEYLHAWRDKAYHTEIALGRLGGASSATMVRAILAKPFSQRVALERLSAEESRVMVQDLLGSVTVPPGLDELITAHTEGNPLFVEELTRSLLEGGQIVRGDAGYALALPAEVVEVPTSIQGVLIERFDRLAPPLKTLLQMASVLGRVFSCSVLRTMTHDGAALEQQLLELEDLDFLYLATLAPEREYSFKHVLTQQAIYDTLLRPRREAYHQLAGEALEALYPDRLEELSERLAHHYGRSANAEKALEYLDLASRKAMRANAMVEAKASFDEAMELLSRLPDTPANRQRRVALLAGHFYMFWLLYRIPEYLELSRAHEPLAQEIDDPRVLGAFYSNMAYCYWIPGHFDAFLTTADRAMSIGENAGNPPGAGLGRTSMLMVWYHMATASYADMQVWKPRAIAACQRDLDLTSYIWSHTGMTIGHAQQGQWQQAFDECEAALRVGQDYGNEGAVSRVAMVLTITYIAMGDYQRAIEQGEKAVRTAPTPADKSWGETYLAFAWCRAGDPERAVETLARLAPLYEAVQFCYAQAMNLGALAEAYWQSGRLAEAEETLDQLVALATRSNLRYWLGSAHRLRAEVARQADPGEGGRRLAAEHFAHSVALLEKIGAHSELTLARAGQARLSGSFKA